jgi:hypothetical protein
MLGHVLPRGFDREFSVFFLGYEFSFVYLVGFQRISKFKGIN